MNIAELRPVYFLGIWHGFVDLETRVAALDASESLTRGKNIVDFLLLVKVRDAFASVIFVAIEYAVSHWCSILI
jgi:hypothetical protein